MKTLLRALTVLLIMISMNACTATTTGGGDDNTTTTAGGSGTSGGTSGGNTGGTSGGSGTLPANVSETGTYTVTFDSSTATLHSFKATAPDGATVNTAYFVPSTVDDSLAVWVTAEELYSGNNDASLGLRFDLTDKNAVTTGDITSGTFSMIQFTPANSTKSYISMYQGNFAPFDIHLTKADFDGTTLHLVGTITNVTLYDSADDTISKSVSISFDITATQN